MLQPNHSASGNRSANARDSREEGSIPGLGRSLGGEKGNTLQHSCLENSTDTGAWRATGPWDCKESDTSEHTHTHIHTYTIVQRLGNDIFKTPCIKSCQRSRAANTSWNVQTTPKFHLLSTLLVAERRKAGERAKRKINRLGCGLICKIWVSKRLALWRLERGPFALGLNLG